MCSRKCARPRWSSSSSTEPALITRRSSSRCSGLPFFWIYQVRPLASLPTLTWGPTGIVAAGSTAALKAAGAACTIVALRAGRIRGMNVQQPADLLRVGQKIEDARVADFDGLLIPGGYIGPDLLRQSASARAFVLAFDASAKPIAVMSHAALVLVSAGLAKGRTLTSWPGVRDDLVNAGATWLNRAVVRDGHILSSRTPQDAADFARELAPFLAGEPQAALDPASSLEESDPAQQSASELPDQSLRWLAAPSLGAMLSLAIL